MLAFSVRRNLLTIWDRSVGDDTIPTVHGLRCISMSWVIMGHTCIIVFKYSGSRFYYFCYRSKKKPPVAYRGEICTYYKYNIIFWPLMRCPLRLPAFLISDNMEFRSLIEKEFFFQTINSAPFSVDTFFFIRWFFVMLFIELVYYFSYKCGFFSLQWSTSLIPLLQNNC